MTTRLKSILYALSVAFLLVLFGWILIRSGHAGYLAVVAAVAALRLARPLLAGTRAWQMVDRVTRRRGALLVLFGPFVFAGIAVALRLWWAFHFEVTPRSDFRQFFDEAAALVQGQWAVLGTSKSPVTVLFYAAFFRLMGASIALVYAINAVVGTLQAVFTYLIARRVYTSRAPAYLAGLTVAVFPSLVMHSALPSSEVVFCMILLVMLRGMLRLTGPARVVTAGALVAASLFLAVETAALHMTRNTGVIVGAWTLLTGLVWARTSWRARAVAAAAFAACTLLFLTPQIAYNYRHYGYFSIQSSQYSALNLLSGTNMKSKGRDNMRDRRMVKLEYSFEDETWPEVSKELRRIAWKRVNKDRRAFLKFALTTKFDIVWCIDQYGATNIRGNPKFETAEMDRKAEPWKALSNRFYILAVLAGSLGLCLAPGRDPGYRAFVVAAGGILFATALLHVFIEAQSRYHVAVVYILAVLAGAIFEAHGAKESRGGGPASADTASASVPDVSE